MNPASLRPGPDQGASLCDARFANFLERHRAAVVAVALDRTGSIDAAEEIAQEVVVKAWEHRHALRDVTSLRAWVFRITVNVCAAWHRRKARLIAAELSTVSMAALIEPQLEHAMRRDAIRQARLVLSSMPPKSRTAMLMCIAGYTYSEIADFLSLSESAVRGRIARARDLMRRGVSDRLAAALPKKEELEDDGT